MTLISFAEAPALADSAAGMDCERISLAYQDAAPPWRRVTGMDLMPPLCS